VEQRRQRSRLTDALRVELEAIEASVDGDVGYKPCCVTLDTGEVRDFVYVQEAGAWFAFWGVDPEDDDGKRLVPIESIVAVESSPSRLPVRFANELYEAGESAMGGCFFRLVLRDGRRLSCETGGAVDFLDWPSGVTPNDVVEVIPHAGRSDNHKISTAPFAWSLYDED
jgi:hypothetical protein